MPAKVRLPVCADAPMIRCPGLAKQAPPTASRDESRIPKTKSRPWLVSRAFTSWPELIAQDDADLVRTVARRASGASSRRFAT